ncbi:uncharacterized protein LOC133907640 isoform X2 [Phragmites australis]|uniref:uncharacterized protein LOC133907640 isoform X2 n=1 Tax=Phragmites australis TaxID=29695 RepID=UPI002D765659|nr:uncharacterized protein LOC133907640 isoform X2 [Phragmites australis]
MTTNICTLQDGISSPIAAHILDFCDDGSGGDLFAAVNAASDMFTASSEDASSSSTTAPPGPCKHCGDNGSSAAAASAFSPMPSLDSALSALLEEDEPPGPDAELVLRIDYAFAAAVGGGEPQPEQQQFGQVPAALPVASATEHPAMQTQMSNTASELMQLASSGYGDECFAAAMAGGGYVGLDEALCQPQQNPGSLLPAGVAEAVAQGGCFFGKDAAQGGFFGTGGTGMMMSMMGMGEIGEYQRMMESASAALATHSPDADSAAAQMALGGNAGEMQMSGSMSPGRLPATTTTETSSLEDVSFKAARISVEERREKIHRYIKKRNERNFSKKIKYACRKTLADSRPRVRGRFAKNDEYGEPSRAMQNHEEYEQIAGVKGEDMLESDAQQAHLSGMNSYMYNYTVESWI